MRNALRLVLLPLLALTVLAGCGDDDDDGGVAQSGDAATTTTAAETTTTVPPEPTEFDVVATDFAFDTGGAVDVPGGIVRVDLTNDGAEEHQATLLRLNDGVTLPQLGAAAASDPTGTASLALTRPYGGPNSVPPDGEMSVTVVLEAGNYVMVCFIPSPSDGVPHSNKGMLAPFTVGPADVEDAALAEGDGTIVARDFTWEVPDDFTGQGTFTFDNDGPQVHEAGIYTIADGSTIEDVRAFLQSTTPAGLPPFSPAGGIAAVAPGVGTTIDLDLDPGTYAFVCFLPDASAGGAPHFTRGMLLEVEVS